MLGGSLSLFGNNEFGLRFPSVIIGLGSVWLTLKLGTELFGRKPGLIAAFVHAIHGMILEMGGGLVSSDHIDTLFTFFFQAGIYAYVKSWPANSKIPLFITGFVIGLAFLTKWIMAFFALVVIARSIQNYRINNLSLPPLSHPLLCTCGRAR